MNIENLIPDLRLATSLAILFAWVIIRANASDESRSRVGVSLLVTSNLYLPILNGIPFLSFRTPIGKSEAIFVWLMISLASLEVALCKKRMKLNQKLSRLLLAMAFFWFYGFIRGLSENFDFRPNFFYLPICLLVLAFLAPNHESLNSIYWIISTAVVLLFTLYLIKFNFTVHNDFVVKTYISSDQIKYQNQVWTLFGIKERYSGPFSHPNGMGTYLSLIILILIGAKRIGYVLFAILGSILLLATSSRGSILSASIAFFMILSFRFLAKFLGRKNIQLRILLSQLIVFIIISTIYTIKSHNGLTGRISFWEDYLEIWKHSPIFGNGIALRSVESTYIYTLASLGVVGLFFLIGIYIILYFDLPNMVSQESVIVVSLFSWIIIRGSTDAIHTFSAWNSGNLAIIVIGIMSIRPTKNNYGASNI